MSRLFLKVGESDIDQIWGAYRLIIFADNTTFSFHRHYILLRFETRVSYTGLRSKINAKFLNFSPSPLQKLREE